MSFSWLNLTRRPWFQNYRDWTAVTLIGSYAVGTGITWWTQKKDNEFVCTHIFTDDESDIYFRDVRNKTDSAVRVKLIKAYNEKIKMMRAEKERAAQLDAFNYLNGKDLKC